jgi:hypothetical protein
VSALRALTLCKVHAYVDDVRLVSVYHVSCDNEVDTAIIGVALSGYRLATPGANDTLEVRFDDLYIGNAPLDVRDTPFVNFHTPVVCTPSPTPPPASACDECPAPDGASVLSACAPPTGEYDALGVCMLAGRTCVVAGGTRFIVREV